MNKKLDTKFLGQNLIILEEVDSTQKYIKNLKEAPDGLVVIAKNQTAGVGTNGRIWYTSKNKNLTFSILLKPNCNIKNIENLTIIIAETIVKTIKELYGYELEIKHPNDIVIDNKKLGGILTETTIFKERVKKIIIGIGLNINQEKFCEELKNIATSLKKQFGKEYDKMEIMFNFLNRFEKEYMKIL